MAGEASPCGDDGRACGGELTAAQPGRDQREGSWVFGMMSPLAGRGSSVQRLHAGACAAAQRLVPTGRAAKLSHSRLENTSRLDAMATPPPVLEVLAAAEHRAGACWRP